MAKLPVDSIKEIVKMDIIKCAMIVTLIRLSLNVPSNDANTEPTPPIGLAYLASVCKQNGVTVHGIDASGRNINKIFKIPQYKFRGNGLEIKEIIDLIDPSTKIIGVASMFSSEWPYVRDCINLLKEKFPKTMIVVGGEHATALPEYNLRDCKGIDYIALGEGEQTWAEIIQRKKLNQDIENLDGLAFIKDGKFVKTKARERIKHIDKILWPDWEVFPIEPYLDNAVGFGPGAGRNMPILATRGCPYECTFCSNPAMYGRRYFTRQVDDLIKEIKHYIEKYKITGLQFYDLTAIIKKGWIIEFCKALEQNNIHLEWSLPSGTRSEALDLDTLKALSKANLRYLVYAPESGSTECLTNIKKKIKLSNMEKSVKYAISQGITVRTNLIIGFPYETRFQIYQTIFQQLKFAFMGVEDIPTYYFNAYPGTELFDSLVKEKKVIINDNFFIAEADLSHYNIGPQIISYNKYVGRYELYIYRTLGMFLSYFISYLTRPKRIFRTIKSIFIDSSSTIVEQRIKDYLRKSKLFSNFVKPFVLKIFQKKAVNN